jgi:hypothetical protein
MRQLEFEQVHLYIRENIDSFHQKRYEKLCELNLKTILKRKNPYLFKAKYLINAGELVSKLLDAYLSSQEETLFGDFLERLAIFVCQKTYGGVKLEEGYGIDLKFSKDNLIYLVEIKSGPHWGNSSQVTKMRTNFNELRSKLLQEIPLLAPENIIAVNGCCYGRCQKQQDGYLKLCGQAFWTFISGKECFYLDIIEPLGYQARVKNEAFIEKQANLINRFTADFIQEYCLPNGEINWERLVKLSSAES